MQLADVRHALTIVKALVLSGAMLLLIALIGGVYLPVTGALFLDMGLWSFATIALATFYARTARAALVAADPDTDLLEAWSDICYELLALMGGAFYGPFLTFVAVKEIQDHGGRTENTPYVAAGALIGWAALAYALRKLVKYRAVLRAARMPADPWTDLNAR